MIHALTFRMTGSLAEAEDLAQETFIAAFEQLDSFRGESRFSSWLHRIATNRCLNWLKRNQRRERAYESWNRENSWSTESELPDTISDEVQAALMKLDAKQRAAIILTTYEGLNHADAARVLGCSETTVSWRIFSARRKLKRWLQPAITGRSS
jgi:RNA polymerase sigma-70 factor (ECF subfamily)